MAGFGRPYQPWSLADTIAVGRRPSGYTPTGGDIPETLGHLQFPYIWRRRKKKSKYGVDLAGPQTRPVALSPLTIEAGPRRKRKRAFAGMAAYSSLLQGRQQRLRSGTRLEADQPTQLAQRPPQTALGAGSNQTTVRPRKGARTRLDKTTAARSYLLNPQTMLAPQKKRSSLLATENDQLAEQMRRSALRYQGGAAALTSFGPNKRAATTQLAGGATPLPIKPVQSTIARRAPRISQIGAPESPRPAAKAIQSSPLVAPRPAKPVRPERQGRDPAKGPIHLTQFQAAWQSQGGKRQATGIAAYRIPSGLSKKGNRRLQLPITDSKFDKAPLLPRDIPRIGRPKVNKTPNVQPKRDDQGALQRTPETDSGKMAKASAAAKAGKKRQRVPTGEEQVAEAQAKLAASSPPAVPSDAVDLCKQNAWRATGR